MIISGLCYFCFLLFWRTISHSLWNCCLAYQSFYTTCKDRDSFDVPLWYLGNIWSSIRFILPGQCLENIRTWQFITLSTVLDFSYSFRFSIELRQWGHVYENAKIRYVLSGDVVMNLFSLLSAFPLTWKSVNFTKSLSEVFGETLSTKISIAHAKREHQVLISSDYQIAKFSDKIIG